MKLDKHFSVAFESETMTKLPVLYLSISRKIAIDKWNESNCTDTMYTQ